MSLTLAVIVGGCGMVRDQTDSGRVSIQGVRPTVEDIDFQQVAIRQNNLITALQSQARLDGVTLGYDDPRWALTLKAGIQLVNGHCDQYLDALFRFNREQRAARQGVTATGSAAAGIMGLTGVGGAAIAVVATAFGLASTLFDASVNSVLFQIEPSALRNIVVQGRQAYLEDLMGRTGNLAAIKSRPDMMIALQGYLTQCSPAAIEANINNAANGSPFAVTSQNPGSDARSAIATGAPAITLLGDAFTLSPRALPPRPPRRPATQQIAPGQLPGEGLTSTQIRAVQAALGQQPTGNLGPKNSPDRENIAEAQAALRILDLIGPDEEAGTLAGFKTRSRLIGSAPMPSQFRTPFERFWLGNMPGEDVGTGANPPAFTVIAPARMRELRARLGLSADPPVAGDWWAGLREALAAKREAAGLPGPPVLGSALFAKITQ